MNEKTISSPFQPGFINSLRNSSGALTLAIILRSKSVPGAVAQIFVSRAAKAVRATMNAATITIYRVVETHVGAIVVGDDAARFSFFEDLEFSLGWFAHPLDRVGEPGLGGFTT